MRLIVNDNWENFSVSFYLEDEKGNRRVIYGQKDGVLFEQTLEEASCCSPVQPLLVMPQRFAREFIKCVVDYASSKQIKTENENLLQGRLTATEKHLEDMRIGFTKLLDKVIETK